MQHNVKVLLGVGVVVRLILLVFGSWQDAALKVKYTDIDYRVYTDAARFLADGKSPYARSTYRYSPLLAILMVPNIWIHDVMGKVMFCIADIVSAMLMQKLMTDYRRVPQEKQWMGLAVWLFSPFTVTISTRGNGEAMVTVMLLTMLLLLYKSMFCYVLHTILKIFGVRFQKNKFFSFSMGRCICVDVSKRNGNSAIFIFETL